MARVPWVPASVDAEGAPGGREAPLARSRLAGRSCARLLARNHLFVLGEAAARELPPVVNLPPANPFWTASAVQKGTVSTFCQLQLT